MSRFAYLSILPVLLVAWCDSALGQSSKLPARAKPPIFTPGQFDGIFFPDVSQALKGPRPKSDSDQLSKNPSTIAANPDQPANDSAGEMASGDAGGSKQLIDWKSLISAQSLEDLIKETKLRLDKIVTTPTAFAGGGFAEARKEFSLLAALFSIVHQYPQPVRWQKSAKATSTLMSRVATNTKVGSRQVFDEARLRMQDLEQLLSGSALSSAEATESQAGNLIDIVPLMQLVDRSYSQAIKPFSANESEFKKNASELERNSQLVAVLAHLALAKGMPNAEDDTFVQLANEMLQSAKQVAFAAESQQAQLARTAAGKLGQSCVQCHENYR